MTRSRAIREMCLNCAGGTNKELTLCHMTDCPVWEYRLGNSFKSKHFKERIVAAKERYPKDWREMINTLEIYVKHAVFDEKRALRYLVWLKGL